MFEVTQPFPGIRPFEEKDWAIFFGRDEQANELLHRIEMNRFVAVVGSSGSGKSSLVKAGLLRLLRQGFLMDVQDWAMLVLRPGRDPFGALAAQLTRRQHGLDDDAPLPPELQVETALLASEIQSAQGGLAEVLSRFDWPAETQFLLVVDQFEEIFGFRSASLGATASRDASERFVELMLGAAAQTVPPPFAALQEARAGGTPAPTAEAFRRRLWVVLTMRSDFIGNCEVFPALAAAVSTSQFLVPILTASQKEEAIVRPGETSCIEGATYPAFSVERSLVNRLVNESGDRPDQLPLMQHALMRTWHIARGHAAEDGTLTLTVQDYEASGQIAQALHEHAESAWAAFKTEPRRARIARALFLAVCDISADGKLTRRRPRVSEIETLTGATVPEIAEVLRAFQEDNRNFLLPIVAPISDHELASTDTLDISHEALLRQWSTYTTWQLEERGRAADLLRLRDRAAAFAKGEDSTLPARAIERARDWRKFATREWAVRYVSEAEWQSALAYIETSEAEIVRAEAEQRAEEAAAKAREAKLIRRARVSTGAVAALVLVMALCAQWWSQLKLKDAAVRGQMALDAQRQATKRERALDFQRFIGLSRSPQYSGDEADSLWALAQSGEEDVRATVIKAWFDDPSAFNSGHGRAGEGLLAAMGLSPKRRHLAEPLAERLMESMLQETADQKRKTSRVVAGGKLWPALAAWASPEAAAGFAGKAATSMKRAGSDDALLLAGAASELLGWAPPAERAPIADQIAERLLGRLDEEPQEGTEATACAVLTSLAGAVSRPVASRIAAEAAHELEKLLAVGTDETTELAELLAKSAGRLDASAAAALVQPSAELLVAAIEKHPAASKKSVTAYPVLSPLLAPAEAARLSQRVVGAIMMPEVGSGDPSGLGSTLAQLSPEYARSFARSLVDWINFSHVGRLPPLSAAVASVLPLLDPELARQTATPVVRQFVRLAGYGQKPPSAAPVLPLVDKLEAGEALKLAALLAKVISDQKADWTENAEVLAALVRCAGGAEGAVVLSEPCAAITKRVIDTDRTKLDALTRSCISLAALLDLAPPGVAAESAKRVADSVEKRIGTSTEEEWDDIRHLGPALRSICGKLDPVEAHSKLLRLARPLTGKWCATAKEPETRWIVAAEVAGLTRDLRGEASALRSFLLANLFLRDTRLLHKAEDEASYLATARTLCEQLSVPQLAEALKWPFCVGERYRIVLGAIEQKTGQKFEGDLRKFCAAAPELGIGNLEAPAVRPSVAQALEELVQLSVARQADELAAPDVHAPDPPPAKGH